MTKWMGWGGAAVAMIVMTGCGPKSKPCMDIQSVMKEGMSEAELTEALGPADESGKGLAGDFINYKCGGEGEAVSAIMRGGKVSTIVKLGGSTE